MSDNYYHGDGSDIIGKANDFLQGKFRYRVLWEDNYGEISSNISNGYRHLSGVSRGSIGQVKCNSTFSSKNMLDGRSFIKKAKAAIAECKILLSYWKDFLFDGSMPSGMNEGDALQYVLNKAYAENAAEDLDDDDNAAPVNDANSSDGDYFYTSA